jgi:hypothetical protein
MWLVSLSNVLPIDPIDIGELFASESLKDSTFPQAFLTPLKKKGRTSAPFIDQALCHQSGVIMH